MILSVIIKLLTKQSITNSPDRKVSYKESYENSCLYYNSFFLSMKKARFSLEIEI